MLCHFRNLLSQQLNVLKYVSSFHSAIRRALSLALFLKPGLYILLRSSLTSLVRSRLLLQQVLT